MSSDKSASDNGAKTNFIESTSSNCDEYNNCDGVHFKLAKQTSQSRLKIGTGGDEANGSEDFDAWMKSRQLLKPDDQLELTEAELGEEIPKVLTPTNTNIAENLVAYSFKEKAFVLLPLEGNIVNIFSFEGTCLHIESEEAQKQIEEYGDVGFAIPPPKTAKSMNLPEDNLAAQRSAMGSTGDSEGGGEDEEPTVDEIEEEGVEGEEVIGEAEGEVEGEEGGDAGDGDAPSKEAPGSTGGTKKRKLINQFNFCERAALTFTNPTRNVETQTIPPPRSTFGSNVLQWVIYDSYTEDFAQHQKEKEKDKKSTALKKDAKKRDEHKEAAVELNKKYLKCWQILERMINQNIYDDIASDYRYWEDPSDEFREGEGTLLPLWKFNYERTKKMNVTDVMFNPNYYDLFAVCFGSHDFMKQPEEGAICLFTIKNPSFPDYIIMTESGVMCCDIHPKYPFLVVIGMYDGNVAVYDLKDISKGAIYTSQGVNGKHLESVAAIKWGPDLADGEINFYTASSDGRVFNWVLMQLKFSITVIITLFLDNETIEGPDGTQMRLKGCATCMTFHPTQPEIFLIGTEEGLIYKCSTAYSSKYLITYNAHYLSVYRIDFNKFNSNIFASCSGDWRIKIWEDMRSEPLFIFDLGSSVGDVRWAPYSSTVFAAATSEGKVHVFDLNVNKYKAICIQAVVTKRRNKLTRLAFNQKLPFIIVGDEKGTTISLKLSPNLRVMVKPPKKQLWLDQQTLQIQKLDRILSLVRELPEGEVIKDTTTTVQS
ncbi:dynein intermediate chain 2, ciliary isoform X2 [Eupeodes corollae]|uniref:dynein intermediate chain 2, ciliary isoform X2 n=1 Tax=Eupeodes corollae TaxID=290404 RepID=UPI00248FDA94|nr:dynein intermediate chain 2, ciliary isoform X2 [Eupeodes corollae]